MDLMEVLESYKEKTKRRAIKRGVTITVSGPAGSGKTTAGEFISKTLGLDSFTAGDVFRKVAKKRGLSLTQLSRTREDSLDIEVDKELIILGLLGRVVLIGRFVGWLLKDEADLNIFVECPMNLRAKRLAKREKITEKEALKDLEERDNADREKYRKLYGIDMMDKSIYDFIIENTGPIEEMEKRILDILELKRLI